MRADKGASTPSSYPSNGMVHHLHTCAHELAPYGAYGTRGALYGTTECP